MNVDVFSCKLCDPDSRGSRAYTSEETLLDHIAAVHNLERMPYLRAIQATEIRPDGPEIDPNAPSETELALLRQFSAEGMDPNDERLKRVCFLIATLRRKEGDLRTQTTQQITPRDLSDLRPIYKEIRDTLAEIKREMRVDDETREDQILMEAALAEAEQYVKDNLGDFQFRCSHCGMWVQTDGLPVWMLFQDRDPRDPDRQRVHVGNPEIFWLVRNGHLPLSLAAFILRTSPEGLLWTSEQRGEPLVGKDVDRDAILRQAEEEVRNTRLVFDDRAQVGG